MEIQHLPLHDIILQILMDESVNSPNVFCVHRVAWNQRRPYDNLQFFAVSAIFRQKLEILKDPRA